MTVVSSEGTDRSLPFDISVLPSERELSEGEMPMM
jgi:hypothetical protein